MMTEVDITTLCPKDEHCWMTYWNKAGELIFFLTSPARSTSTAAAQDGSFALYAVTADAKGARKAKKLGQGGNPAELEARYQVAEAMRK